MIISDKKEDNSRMSSKEIIFVLLENIRSKCKFAISIGLTNYLSENEESYKEWYKRANKYLNNAKISGKDCVCWGQNMTKFKNRESNSNDDDMNKMTLDSINEDDLVLMKSLKEIEVSSLYFCFFYISKRS